MEIDRRAVLAGIAAALPAGALAQARPAAAPLTVQRLAWAGIRLETASVALFIDAVAPDGGSGRDGPALATDAARRFALVTHHHPDHCAPAALAPLLGDRGYLVAREDVLAMFEHRQVSVQPARPFEPVFLSRGGAEFVAWAVPAADGLGSPQCAWVVAANGRRIIHCGDTIWHGHWWDIGRAYGPFDAAFLPINGFRQPGGRFAPAAEPMGLTPEQAVHAAVALGAALAVPIHYGASPSPGYVEEADALGRFRRAAAASSLPARIAAPGETFRL